MKNIILLIACCICICSCNTSQLGAAATGTSLGGMFGSSIGGLAGGYRGHQIGTLVGMTTGAAVGIAAATPKDKSSQGQNKKKKKNDIVEYGEYEPRRHNNSDFANAHPLEVTKVLFTDANNNHCLEAYESGALEITFVNRGNVPLHNVKAEIVCNNRHIDIASLSPAKEIQPLQRVRYRVDMIGKKRLKSGYANFEVRVKFGKKEETIKSFQIETNE